MQHGFAIAFYLVNAHYENSVMIRLFSTCSRKGGVKVGMRYDVLLLHHVWVRKVEWKSRLRM